MAARAIAQFDLEAVASTFVSASENTVYRIDADDGSRYALRVHRAGYHDLAELESENAWTAALSDAGIHTPRPVPTRDGRWYATVPFGDDGETRHVGLTQWLDGEPMNALLRRRDPRLLATCGRLGELLARMHLHVDDFSPPPGFERHRLDAEGLIGDDPWWGPFWHVPEFSARERQAVLKFREDARHRLAAYGAGPEVFNLIHADLVPTNVLVRPDGEIAAIDFDDAAFGYRLYDIAAPLARLSVAPDFEQLQEALLAGYRRRRPLADEELRLLPMFRLIRCLVTIGWYDTRLTGHLTADDGEAATREALMAPLVAQARALIEARPVPV